MNTDTTIAAISTPPGVGAIAMLRLSGKDAINICEQVFTPTKQDKILSKQPPYTIHHGSIVDGNKIIDQVLVSIFRAPQSYTGEDMIEISCHGSTLIQQQILEVLIRSGATPAQAGEFTLRAFLNGKMDLSQAEGVADLIASSSEVARKVAMNQVRGGFSGKLAELREKLLHFISLIELELDFSEEDVEFADRKQLLAVVDSIAEQTNQLLNSFKLGNVIKTGIPVTIAGKPNVGKSTLLNKILNEEKAIVSDIAGTTRDAIEDTISIKGIAFRFIDTAGLRHTTDSVEIIGIERAYTKISQALVILMLIDARETAENCTSEITSVNERLNNDQRLIIIVNKADMVSFEELETLTTSLKNTFTNNTIITMSAKRGDNIDLLTNELVTDYLKSTSSDDGVIITNARHYESLHKAMENLERAKEGINNQIPTDLLALDIRQVLHYIGLITGNISTEEILGSIFSKFCIGK
ncbi:MAG: tRNA uridine-5-carboxymethylaminomethyl(34) synthesis GTPase MnmE [Bacteroidales bacterium]